MFFHTALRLRAGRCSDLIRVGEAHMETMREYAERATFLALKGSSSQRFVSTMLPGVDASAIEKSELSKSGGQAAFGLLSPVVLIFGSALH